nr:zinc finger, CCHC-type [Tanacetum cinerariifolium]
MDMGYYPGDFEGFASKKVEKKRDTIFDENRFSSVPRPSIRIPNGTKDNGGSVVPKEVTKEDVAFQKEVINDEMDSIIGNNTWVLADLPLAPIFIRYDSAATFVKAYSQMYNGKSRHLGVRHSMIHELIKNGVISIEFMRIHNSLLRKLG